MDEYSKTMPDPDLDPTGRGDKSIFEHAIENFENFIDRANGGLDGILQMCGICDEWRAADAICKFMREMVGMVEDILLRLAEGGDSELAVAFMEEHLTRCDKSVKMAPRSWLSEEQQTFVLTYHESFLECKKKGNYNSFWPPFFKKWEECWPITLEGSLEPLDENARLKQMAKARDALQTCLMVKLRNDFGNSKIGRRANTAGNTIVSKLIGDITIKSGKKKSRPLNATEVYAKKYYSSRVQPAVKEELDAMKNAVDAPEPKKRAIQVVRKQLASCWENESAQVKEEVTKLAQEMKEKRKKEKEAIPDKKEVPKELVICRLTEILSTFFTELHDLTGWTFSILLAGPDPANAGKLDVSSLHIGTTLAGNRFNQAYLKFEESIMVPYFEFASQAFPDAALLLSKGTTTPDQNDTSLPDTQALPAHNSHNSVTADISDTQALPAHNSHNSVTADISLATISSASSSTPDTSLATVSPDTSLATVSPDTLLTTDTSFMASVPSRLQSAYNFFQFDPPDLQDDDVDLDFNSTILPMPPNYKPPSLLPPSSPMEFSSTSSGMDWFASSRLSPLTSTSRLGDLNSAGPLGHDSDNALTTLQSQASPPRLCHISSILTKTATANSYASAPNNNPFAPMATSTLAHSPTSVEIPSVQPSSVVPEPPTMEPIMATPSPPATVGKVLLQVTSVTWPPYHFPLILALTIYRLVLLYRLSVDRILGTVPVPRIIRLYARARTFLS
ncbi:uncharacterized protein F5147DRAFT_768838 [Suillus discolor]|uniref:Uncharacterized protein n=1 Tax=Suillus discolor TaxID=1912936 RepID=A0A9P7FG91_9AGAM|nr:uncharacterized protein F5147DRAFT_768838 [Suillus discolor]KAG2116472.1 hypothetical protein F5147DRAFT_768838 [Suillus discolor]